eukprot:4510504-Lingulodinium_polyedra.AAC.1
MDYAKLDARVCLWCSPQLQFNTNPGFIVRVAKARSGQTLKLDASHAAQFEILGVVLRGRCNEPRGKLAPHCASTQC